MNDTQVRVVIAGAGGRMGRQLIQTTLQMSGIELSAALEHEHSSVINIDAGELVGLGRTGVKIQSNLKTIKDNFDVFIDFTCPESTMKHLDFCYKYSKAMVIGTTGFSDIEKIAIKNASQKIAIVFTANFSIGINIMLKLLEKTAKAIGHHADIEIIEAHHRNKVDSPSGTAIAMGEVIAQAMNRDLRTCTIYMHKGCLKERVPGTISFSNVRAGDIIGEHTVMFVNKGERLEITHRASSRAIFANGAIRSALAIKSKDNGLFDMQDILDLNKL